MELTAHIPRALLCKEPTGISTARLKAGVLMEGAGPCSGLRRRAHSHYCTPSAVVVMEVSRSLAWSRVQMAASMAQHFRAAEMAASGRFSKLLEPVGSRVCTPLLVATTEPIHGAGFSSVRMAIYMAQH